MPATDMTEPSPASPAELRDLARMSLYAALIGAGAFIHIPVGPMHISLQTMMVMLAGFVLGPRKAVVALIIYIACGFLGLPMFGRGKAGPASFLGPTAGFFLGFVPGAFIAGCSAYFTETRAKRLAGMIACGLAGTVICLLLGTAVLRWRFIPDWNRALLVGFYPFIAGDVVKMIAAAAIKEAFFPVAAERRRI